MENAKSCATYENAIYWELTGGHFICTSSHFILTTGISGTSTDEGIKAQRGKVACPGSHSS